MLGKLERILNEVVLVNQLMGLFTDANGTSKAVALHLVGDKYVLTKDIIANHFGSNDTTDYLASMDADPHV